MTAPAWRPGPRTDVDVPTALVDAAEVLFGTTSVDAVSLRAVAREAGVAPAALTHYFPDKTALVGAVLRRRADPIGAEVRERLIALVEAEEDPTPRDLVECVAMPFVAMLDAEPVAGLAWMRLFTALGLAEEPMWLRGVGRAPSIADHRIISRSSAVSRRHQINSRISEKVVGCLGGAGIPRASVEYR